MVDVKIVTQEEFDKEMKASTVKGEWNTVIENLRKNKKPIKIEGMTRGQVAALYRKAKDEELKIKTNYKDGSVLLSL